MHGKPGQFDKITVLRQIFFDVCNRKRCKVRLNVIGKYQGLFEHFIGHRFEVLGFAQTAVQIFCVLNGIAVSQL